MITGIDQGGDGKPATGRLSREHDVRRSRAAFQERLVSRESVIDRRRERVLGGKPVVNGKDPGAGPPADLGGQVSGLERISKDVHAAVEVQDDVARFDSGDGDLGDRDAAQGGRGHGQVGG